MATKETNTTKKTSATKKATARPAPIKTDSKKFLSDYGKYYEYLYDSTGKRSMREEEKYNKAIDEFDYKLKTDKKFKENVRKFCQARHDIVSSDREAAAYMYALNAAKKGNKK